MRSWRGGSRPFDDQSLGVEVRPGTRQTDSTLPETDKRLVENRRDVYQSQGSVEISVSCCRFGGEYPRLYAKQSGIAKQRHASFAKYSRVSILKLHE
jgi:hypothetical protein